MSLFQTFPICPVCSIVGNVSIFMSGNALIPSTDLDQLGFILKNALVANLIVLLFLSVSLGVAKSYRKSIKSIQPAATISVIVCTIHGSIIGLAFIRFIEFPITIPLSVFMILGTFWNIREVVADGNLWIKKESVAVTTALAENRYSFSKKSKTTNRNVYNVI